MTAKRWREGLGVLLLLLCGAAPARAQERVTYDDHVQRLLTQHCGKCHGAERMRAGLDVTSYLSLLKGASSGVVVEAGDPDASTLYLAITHRREPTMPPGGGKVPDAVAETVRRWIEGGLLESAGSQAKAKKKRSLALSVVPGAGRPESLPELSHHLPQEPFVVPRRAGAITALTAHPWLPLVALGGPKQVLLYDPRQGELRGVLPFPEGQANVLAFSRDGRLLLAGGGQAAASGRAVAWDLTDGRRVIEMGDEDDALLACDLAPDRSQLLVGGSSKHVRLLDTASGAALHTLKKHTDWVTAGAFSPDGVLFASADRSGGLVVWEALSGREMHTLAGGSSTLTGLAWRDDSNVLASVGEDGQLRLFEMVEGQPVKSFAAHDGGALAVAMAHDGRLISGGRDKHVKLWSPDGTLLRTFGPMGDLVLEVAIDDEGTRVIGADGAGSVAVWNAVDGALITTLSATPARLEDRLLAARARQFEAVAAVALRVPVAEAAQALARAPAAEQSHRAQEAAVALVARDAIQQQLQQAREASQSVASAAQAAVEQVARLEAERAVAREAVAPAQVALVAAEPIAASAAIGSAARGALAQQLESAADAAQALAAATPADAELAAVAKAAVDAAAAARAGANAASEQAATAARSLEAARLAAETATAQVARLDAAVQVATAERDVATSRAATTVAVPVELEAAFAQAQVDFDRTAAIAAQAAAVAAPIVEAAAQVQAQSDGAARELVAAHSEVARLEAARIDLTITAEQAGLWKQDAVVAECEEAVALRAEAAEAARSALRTAEQQLTDAPTVDAALLAEIATRQAAQAASEAALRAIDESNTQKGSRLAELRSFTAELSGSASGGTPDAPLAQAVMKCGEALAALEADLASAQASQGSASAAVASAAQAVHEAQTQREAHVQKFATWPAVLAQKRELLVSAEAALVQAKTDVAQADAVRAEPRARIEALVAAREAWLQLAAVR